MEWQPIETAPKEGREILVWCPTFYRGKGGCRVVVWCNFTNGPGWYGMPGGRLYEPTHWMLLPAPPLPTPAEAPNG